MFLALRGEEGQVECFWPVPLEEQPGKTSRRDPSQLQLLSEDGAPPTKIVLAKSRRLR